MSDTVAVVTAAGSGERLGAGMPKAFVELGGRIMLEHAVDGHGVVEARSAHVNAMRAPRVHLGPLPLLSSRSGQSGRQRGTDLE